MSFLCKLTRLAGCHSLAPHARLLPSNWMLNSKWDLHTSATLCLKARPMREEKYRKLDNIEEKYQLIYRAPMENYLAACKNFSAFSFVTLSGMAALQYLNNVNFLTASLTINYGELMSDESELIGFLIGFLMINVMIRVMLNHFPLRIYKSHDKYIAVFEGFLPLMRSKMHFMKGDVTVVPPRGILPWREARFKIGRNEAILLVDYFKTHANLNEMLKE